VALRDAAPGVVAMGAAPALHAETARLRRVGVQAGQPAGERCRIARRDQVAGFAIDHHGVDAANRCPNNRRGARHGPQHRCTKSVVARRRNANIDCAIPVTQRGSRLRPQESNFDIKPACQVAQALKLGPVRWQVPLEQWGRLIGRLRLGWLLRPG